MSIAEAVVLATEEFRAAHSYEIAQYAVQLMMSAKSSHEWTDDADE